MEPVTLALTVIETPRHHQWVQIPPGAQFKENKMIKIETEKLPILSWCNKPEETAIAQAKNLANLPFAISRIALMPDTHMGYGMPIGGVLATKGVIVPNAVGADIGCGMIAVKTHLTTKDATPEWLKKIRETIKTVIPMGVNRNATQCPREDMPDMRIYSSIIESCYNKARTQMGTLGSGNHFIEIQKDPEQNIWIMIHSGSRNMGKKVGDYFNEMAREFLKHSYSKVERGWDLDFLPTESPLGREYIGAMNYCIEYARINRRMMMQKAIEIIGAPARKINDAIDIKHNYAECVEEGNEMVWLHRKGAISAKAGEVGIIPGSQGTKSYIVEGLGNKASFQSSSHGAGRRMSRKQAMRELVVEIEIEKMDKLGIIHGIKSTEDMDEAPSAYKDIDVVMEEQKDLTKIKTELTPIMVIKG